MSKNTLVNFGEFVYDNIEKDEYLNELYENILHNYSLSLFNLIGEPKEIKIDDALGFADILSKSTHATNADKHKIWGQEIVALLDSLYPDSPAIKHYLGSVLTSVGNYRGLLLNETTANYKSNSLSEQAYNETNKNLLAVPADPTKFFFRSQRKVYDNLNKSCFSFSGPTSMGKSFVMRMFIKEQVMNGSTDNFVIVVPSKALINEVSTEIIKKDLQDLLKQQNYKVITSAGDSSLEKNDRNYICVLTPERLLYFLIRHKHIPLNYVFIDEAHKIAVSDSRSTFYYRVVSILEERENIPNIIFASPNIPNPDVFLGLVSNCDTNNNLSSSYSPVTQIKYLVDFVAGSAQIFNEHSRKWSPINSEPPVSSFKETLRLLFNRNTSTIVYINSKPDCMEEAERFTQQSYSADGIKLFDALPDIDDNELKALSTEIRNLIHKEFLLAKLILKGVAFHVGYLPTSIRMNIERLYRERKIRILFCTSTLVEGVNLPADNLFMTTYRKGKGSTKLKPVDFRNLLGRVGRIEYNLYGNVFLTRIKEKIKTDEFVKLVEAKVPAQTLSHISMLKDQQKLLIVASLIKGDMELTGHTLKVEEYKTVRKFAQILVRDILKDRNTVVRRAFEKWLKPDVVERIKAAFAKNETKPDDDINISVDQTIRLTDAIKNGLIYPELSWEKENREADHQKTLAFLNQLHSIFKWGKYERDTGIEKLSSLTWYATLLNQWMSGNGLSMIMLSSLFNAENRMWSNNPKLVFVDGKYTEFNSKIALHKNLVIGETLQAIEGDILFRFSNYFARFTECYKRINKIKDTMPNDWYEFVEYGTYSSLSIMLQRHGFSRETALFIRENRQSYVLIVGGEARLRKSIAKCEKEAIRNEVETLMYNVPELFVD